MSDPICTGNGVCLQHHHTFNTYCRNETCGFNCKPIKCINFMCCGSIFPEWISKHRLCTSCISGTNTNTSRYQKALNDDDKPFCYACYSLDMDTSVKWPTCKHEICRVCYLHTLRVNYGLDLEKTRHRTLDKNQKHPAIQYDAGGGDGDGDGGDNHDHHIHYNTKYENSDLVDMIDYEIKKLVHSEKIQCPVCEAIQSFVHGE